MFNADEIKIANATSRSRGAVCKSPLVYRHFRAVYSSEYFPPLKVLDFGAGKDATHTLALRADGYDIVAHEFGDNVKEGLHDPYALARAYDVVLASNVLNVQSSMGMLRATLTQLRNATLPGGTLIANYPKSPRKLELGDKGLVGIMGLFFPFVNHENGIIVAVYYDE